MTPLIARMMGQSLAEDDSVPVPAITQTKSNRFRGVRRSVRRRSVAALMMGEAALAEADYEDGSIFPDGAEEVKNPGVGSTEEKDKAPAAPGVPSYGEREQLMSPAVALVAPDVTPKATEPLDPSQVPHANVPPMREPAPGQPQVNPLDVLLGRRTGQRQEMPQDLNPVTVESTVSAEAAQATINATLNVGGPGPGLGQGVPMPPPTTGTGQNIMEAYARFAPKPKNSSY